MMKLCISERIYLLGIIEAWDALVGSVVHDE